ncbi:MAG: histidine phosphatase family protein [Blautia sp.]|nr:histidine phosphatase family protein [Blautia sp.]
MRLIIIRHGDPNYEIDSLTEQGWREAELLATRIARLDVKEFYVSPLGRARDTAGCTLEKMHRTATVCEWLQEFSPRIHRPDDKDKMHVPWDWLPADWTKEDTFYDADTWTDDERMKAGRVREEYDRVCAELDKLLAAHGYVREHKYYRAERPNNDTLVFFCHFGLECVLLSHLLSVSPMILWQGFCAAPTSVTTVYTEERREGIASFRVNTFGDISHLYAADEEPSFSARFCECFANKEERHD